MSLTCRDGILTHGYPEMINCGLNDKFVRETCKDNQLCMAIDFWFDGIDEYPITMLSCMNGTAESEKEKNCRIGCERKDYQKWLKFLNQLDQFVKEHEKADFTENCRNKFAPEKVNFVTYQHCVTPIDDLEKERGCNSQFCGAVDGCRDETCPKNVLMEECRKSLSGNTTKPQNGANNGNTVNPGNKTTSGGANLNLDFKFLSSFALIIFLNASIGSLNMTKV